jgi:hypothetical protein
VFAEEESNLKLQVKFVAKNRSKRRFRQNVEVRRNEFWKLVFMIAIATRDEL